MKGQLLGEVQQPEPGYSREPEGLDPDVHIDNSSTLVEVAYCEVLQLVDNRVVCDADTVAGHSMAEQQMDPGGYVQQERVAIVVVCQNPAVPPQGD